MAGRSCCKTLQYSKYLCKTKDKNGASTKQKGKIVTAHQCSGVPKHFKPLKIIHRRIALLDQTNIFSSPALFLAAAGKMLSKAHKWGIIQTCLLIKIIFKGLVLHTFSVKIRQVLSLLGASWGWSETLAFSPHRGGSSAILAISGLPGKNAFLSQNIGWSFLFLPWNVSSHWLSCSVFLLFFQWSPAVLYFLCCYLLLLLIVLVLLLTRACQ